MRQRNVVVLAVIFIFFSFIVGTVYGFGYATGACVEIGLKFLSAHNITIEIDEKLIKQAVFQYRERIRYIQ